MPENSLSQLRQRLAQFEPARGVRPCVSSGCAALDRLLPEGGFPRGSLVEWITPGSGSGAGVLVAATAREALREGGVLVVVDRQGLLYPPALWSQGIDLHSTILVRPTTAADERWAIDQALRCEQTALVWGWPERIDGRTFRRWQLAAEANGTLGLLVRPDSARGQPSWAEVRLWAMPQASRYGWRWRVKLLRSRGATRRGEMVLEFEEATGEIHEAHPSSVASPLAPAAVARRASSLAG